ncbi:hypothetical protein BGY98DRAFT_354986 [Russula aff. rugulosa BPL654]|nr:hypothetical protein BGY98DRAFT_354986 [Russula aff. rugulosa BPL654]
MQICEMVLGDADELSNSSPRFSIIVSHTSHNRSPSCKLTCPVWATQVNKYSSRRFLQYFVLHLNHVRYDPAAGNITKTGKSIRFGPELEIPLGNDFHSPFSWQPSRLSIRILCDFGHFRHYSSHCSPTSEPPHYKLYGVLCHHGESVGSGHYTVDILHLNRDGDTESLASKMKQ